MMAEQHRRKRLALSMAAIMVFASMTLALTSPAFAAETAEPTQKVARAAPTKSALPTKPTEQAPAAEAEAAFPATVKKQVASVGMLLLLLAAAPGNVARKVDQAIQNTDFGKKPTADKSGADKFGADKSGADKASETHTPKP